MKFSLIVYKSIIRNQIVIRRYRKSAFYTLFALTCGFSIAGCGGTTTPGPDQSKKAEADQLSEQERCEKKLATAVSRMEPQAMATITRPETIVGGLNDWLTTCVPENEREAAVSEQNKAFLSPAIQRLAASARFTESDSNYVRDCLLLKGLATATWKHADTAAATGFASDTERVVSAFDELMRTVALIPSSENRVPIGLYEVLVTGRGRTEDRIWIFAEVLRQQQLDAVLLETDAAPIEGSSAIIDVADRIVAVFADNGVLLFDPLRGTAIPTADEVGVRVRKPAGLDVLTASDRWKGCRVSVIAQPAAFSPRMSLLQRNLNADSAAVLYEEMAGGNSEIQPLIERVISGSGNTWTKDQITLWSYPEQTVMSAIALSEEQKQQYKQLMRSFDSPFERDPLKSDKLVNDPGFLEENQPEEVLMARRIAVLEERLQKMTESSEEMFGKPSRRLLKARIEQIMGAADVGMIQQLQQVRLASMQETIEVEIKVSDKKIAPVPVPLPEAIRAVHRGATGDTLYWTALCQVSRGDAGAAITTLRNYRRQYPEDKWNFPSMVVEALLLMDAGDVAPAKELLQQADQESNPERIRVQWILSRMPQ